MMNTSKIVALLFILFHSSYCDFTYVQDKLLDLVIPLENNVSKEIAREVKMEATEMIAHYGYLAENHTVQTKDGYLLGIHRIPKSKNGSLPSQPYPILLQHGVLCCSGNFIDNADDSLAFFLADLGYDVWLGNLRGNRYSRKHMTLSTNDDEFWDFSWDEHAAYDLPKMIDYITDHTRNDQLILVAHSLGTTVSFAMLSSLPEYNNKVKGYIALGPVGSINYIPSFSKVAAQYNRIIQTAVKSAKINQFTPHTHLMENLLLHFCPSSRSIVCKTVMATYAGYDSELINKTRIPVYASDCTGGTGVKVLSHLAQLYEANEMTHYDYGDKENLIVYGQQFPPKYVLGRITTPIILVHAANDPLSDPLDVEILRRKLKTVILKELFPNPMATHSAFFWIINAKKVFYNRFAELLKLLQ